MNSSILQTFGWFTLLTLISSIPQPTTAQPITPAADGTSSRITPDGQRYDIDGGTLSPDGANLFHSFQKFGLDPGQTANFISNPQIQNILGRVIGGDPSIINGLIQITGGNSNLFLMNPAGILFGPNASLNIPADFTATTASGIGFGNSWFNAFGSNDYINLVGTPSAFSFNMSQLGTIINEGNLTLTPGSNLNLFANTVINTGTLATPGGNINITAIPSDSPLSKGGQGGSILRISQPGHILSLEIIPTANNNQSLPQLLTGGDPIHHATTVQKLDDGTIRLTGSQTPIPLEPGVAVVSGNVDVGGLKPNYELNILGDKIALIGANIDASGTNGGGNIHIGGNYQGAGPLPNATHTYIDTFTNITANAINRGNGGEIIIWSDNTTQFHGNISATGIENGGFVEVSGKQNLIFRGNVDLSATSGNNGTLLLDPENITIVNGSGGAHDSQLSDNQILFGDAGTTFTISETKLESLDGNAAVELQATNNITIEDLADNSLTFQSGTGAITFTADADNDGSGAFTMNSGDSIFASGRPFTINAATITLGNLNTSSPTANGGSINLNAAGQITTGNLDSTAGTTGNGGNITITSTNGGIDITAGLLEAHSFDGNGGNINLMAAADIKTGAVNSHSGQLSSMGSSYEASINAGGTGEGGDVTITSQNGGIEVGAVQAVALSHGGNITLAADLDIKTANLESSSTSNYLENPPETWANAGNVSVTSSQGSIQTANIFAISWRGTAGNVQISAWEDIQTGDILSSFIPSVSLLDENLKPQGGDINITSHQGEINLFNPDYGLPVIVANEGGDININAANDIRFDSIDTYGNEPGNITINSRNGGINGIYLHSVSHQGNGGNIIVNAASNINIIDISSNSYNGSSGGDISITSYGGSIYIYPPSLITNPNFPEFTVINSSAPKGVGGDINITAFGNITTSSINSFGYLQGGNISITSHANSITIINESLVSNSANGTGGDINLSASGAILSGNIDASGASGGGDITLTSTWGDIDTSGGQLNADSPNGTNGNIAINANTGSIILGELTGSQNINIINGGTDNPLGNNPGATVDADADTINRQSGQVSLQAHNDITVSEPIVTSSISSLELKAGRNININADIDTSGSNGNITLQGNHNGANPTYRQPGAGNIIMAPGTNINAGSGDILIQLGTLAEVGKITLANLDTTDSVNVIAPGGNIQAADSGSMITANNASFLTYENGGIGTPDEPLAITVNNLSAQAGSSGAFFNSPHQGVNVGGANGQILGISTSGGGDIGVSALGNITISEDISTQVGEGNAGKITLTSTEGSINSLDSKISSYSNQGNGGDVTLTASGDISTSSIESYGLYNGGQITITSQSGGIDVAGDISSFGTYRNAGFVTISAFKDIKAGHIMSESTYGAGGNISIISKTSVIDINQGSIFTNSFLGGGAGNINLTALGEIKIESAFALSQLEGGDITITSSGGGVTAEHISSYSDSGTAGNVTLSAAGDIHNDTIRSQSSYGNGGTVNLSAAGDIRTGIIESYSRGRGEGGNITITSSSGAIDATGNLGSYAALGHGGDVTLKASGPITTTNISSRSGFEYQNVDNAWQLVAVPDSQGNGGNITIESRNSSINTSGGHLDSRSTGGGAGHITITANQDITTSRLLSSAEGVGGMLQGGDITITSKQGSINTTAGDLSQEVVILATDDAATVDVASIFGQAQANLQAHATAGTGGNVTLEAAGNITTSHISSFGPATSGAISVTSGGNIQTGVLFSFSESGQAGSVTLTGNNGSIATNHISSYGSEMGGDVTITGKSFDIGAATINSYSENGTAGNVTINVNGDFTLGGDAARSGIRSEGAQSGGNISISSNSGTINTRNSEVLSYSEGGTAGNVMLRADGDVATGNIRSQGSQQGGNLSIISFNGAVDTSWGLLSSYSDNGTAGYASLSAFGDVSTGDISSYGYLSGGSISLGSTNGVINTTWGKLESFSPGGDAGAVTLEAPGNIATGDIVSEGNNTGGSITITTDGAVDLTNGTLNSYSARGRAGNVTITGKNDISLGGDAARSAIRSEGYGAGGDITITSIEGNIDTSRGNLDTYSLAGEAGTIILRAGGSVNSAAMTSYGNLASGDVTIQANGGNLTTGEIKTIAPNGTSGTVTLNNFSHNGDIVTANITTEGGTAAGDITVKSTDGAITTENLSSSSSGGDGGDVTLEAEEDITAGNITSSGENNSGDIAVTSNDGSVTTDDIATTANQGDAGDVTVQAENDINTGNISSVAGGNSGDITVNSDSGSVNSGNIATIAQTGASGDVTVGAFGDINTGDITSQGALGSGDINLTSVTGQVNTGEVYTNTGTVNITAGADVVNSVSPVNGDLNPNEAMLANPGNPAIANQLAVMNELILTVQNDASMNSSLLPSEKVFSQETLSSSASQELLASLKVMNSNPLAMNAESAVLALEKSRGDEYGAYFGQDFSNDLQSTVSIREALGKIAAETGYQSAIIYVMAQPDQLELIVVTGSGQPIRKTVPDAPRDKVLATVEEFRNKLTSSFRTNSQTYLPSAQQLYQWLITPIEAELQAAGINTLLFSMDGGLRTVPMAALHDGHQFLVEKYSMSLIPSVSLIDTRYRHLKDTRVLAMGASMFEDLAPLPAVPVELSAVTEDLWQGEEFLNENFTRDNLVQQRRQNPYPMIHLATHADFKPGAPENSYIQLWGEEQLRLDELRELGWQNPAVDLLVLSACRTALGDEQAEMGFAGLAVQAGVKSALASLWYVSDEGTLALMTEFYRHLEGAKIKGEALRQAQLAMIRGHMDVRSGTLRNDAVASLLPLPPELEQVENSNLSHPYYWSGFTMIGSPW